MKSVFALIAAVAVIASAQASFAASCPMMSKGGRNGTFEPTSAAVKTVKQSVKSVR